MDGTGDVKVYSPSQLPSTLSGRLGFIEAITHVPVLDADGNDTGETESLISDELASRLLEAT